MRLLSITVPLLLVSLALAATGGPDDAGMTSVDSNEADGPSHAWLDASAGTAYALGDDETVTIELPFGFDFYGTERLEATISSNGVLFFSGASTLSTGICPDSSTSWTGIAAYWDDLGASTVHTETFGTYPWRTFVVSWDDVSHATAGGAGRFQLWLLEGRNESVVVLDDTTWGNATYDNGATATIGTNGTSAGLAWSCNTTFTDGASIWFGDEGVRPDRAEIYTDDVDDPWTGQSDFDYGGRALAVGDVNGDGDDDLIVGTQDHSAGEVALIYRPGSANDLGSADAVYAGETNDDAFGSAIVTADVDGDGADDLFVGAPDNDDTGSRAGAVYLFGGGDVSGALDTSDALAEWTGPATGTPRAGTSLATGDLNGDGYVDLAVGAPYGDGNTTDAGSVYIVYGSGSAATGITALGADAQIDGMNVSDQLGAALAFGDLDGVGGDDLILAATYDDDGASNAGTVYVVGGAPLSGDYDIDTLATCSFSTPGSGARLGSALLVADLDGSGILDLAVGAPAEDTSYTDGGKVYVAVDPGATCPAAANLSDTIVSGTATSANVGSSLTAGDIDGDGVDDLIVGAPNMTLAATGGGVAYVYTTLPTGAVTTTDADHAFAGSERAGALATALAVADNADGTSTLVATAPYASVNYSSEGAVYQWTWQPSFQDADGDGFVDIAIGGNDCDDMTTSASPDGTDLDGDSIDGDCDGWTDGVVIVRADADEFAWDLDQLGGTTTDSYTFDAYSQGATIDTYGDLDFTGDLTASATVYGATADGMGAHLTTGSTNSLAITFADGIDAIALRVLDPEDDFTLVATGPSGAVVSGYTFALDGDNRSGGVYRGFTFIDEVSALSITGATTNGFGIDTLEVAWAADSDRDGDGYTDAEGDCDDSDDDVSPGATEILGNGVDDDCDGVIDAGNATAYTTESGWEAAAALTLSEVIDFEGISNGQVVDDEYADLGVIFDGDLSGLANIDGTPANDTQAARATASTVTFLFNEDQPAVGFYVLDGDVSFTVNAYDDNVLLYTTTFSPSTGSAFYGLVFDLTIDELEITGVDTWGLDDVTFSALGLDDADGDGQTEREGDCDDSDASSYTGAPEIWYDGLDEDCAGGDDDDADLDGEDYTTDCDDTDDSVNTSATEVYYDGVDQNCDALSDYDQDGDAHDDLSWGGDDCDDDDSAVNPAATEVYYDGVDQDCAGDDDYDADGDGIPINGSFSDVDCDDTDASINPDATETYYDGVDQDCGGDAESDYDADQDGFDATAWGGDDCEDAEPLAYPGATGEACYDGVDTDCDGGDDNDCDGDGYASSDHGGDDCDDTDVGINPAAVDTVGDGIDTNCDGAPDYDYDLDGYDGDAYGGADCDDGDATINPGAAEVCYDGVDTDCDAWDDNDCDLDGYADDGHGGTDCDDTVGGINPGAEDYPYDGIDSDCDGGSEYDIDGDGYATSFYAGDDCDDMDDTVHPGAVDTCYDGVDSDCGDDDDDDCDGDGYAADGAGGSDCDDGDATISPAATEIDGDGIDQDCDGIDTTICTDCDADGFENDVDCDDENAAVYPGAADVFYDGVDADCDGASDYDADADGADAIAWGGGDCDDADDEVSPLNTEDPCGGGDQDCDGTVDDDCVIDTGGDDTGDSADTDIEPHDTATRDTANDWRPDHDSATGPSWKAEDEGCGCDTPNGMAGVFGVLVAGAVVGRRRR